MIADSAIKAKVNNFSKLTNHCGGRKLELFLQINILIYMVGSCISYQIISNLFFLIPLVTTLFVNVFKSFGFNDEDQFLESWKFRALQGAPVALLILFPMSLIRDMSGFRYISFASIFALLYTGIVLICEMPAYIEAYYPTAEMPTFKINLDFFNGACITFFAYTC